jgi:hypothetical protein
VTFWTRPCFVFFTNDLLCSIVAAWKVWGDRERRVAAAARVSGFDMFSDWCGLGSIGLTLAGAGFGRLERVGLVKLSFCSEL